jgi:multimeric flavodoxin WrbA
MNITIINGNPESSSFDRYLTELKDHLENIGNQVTLLNLREITLQYCVGCFGCWVKTPGECSNKDEADQIHRAVIHSDFTLWAAPLRMGFPSALLKKALDKSIPLIHPYFVVDRGEAHHRPRYDHYPRVGLLMEPESDTDDQDLEIVANIFSRLAVNMKSELEFALTTDTPTREVAKQISSEPETFVPHPRNLGPTTGTSIQPPSRLTLFNGSPRGSKGNTPIMLTQFGEGFASETGNSPELYHLNRLKSQESFVQILAESECVWLGFPLYTDAMPGIVKAFLEKLAPLQERDDNPPIGFLVQSGFPEALHSRYVERYLEKLAARLHAPYLGTIVKGSGEGVRMMPEDRNAKLFGALQGLGRSLAQTGKLNPKLLSVVAGVERYPAVLAPFFKLFTRLPIASWYWDSQLKENGVYEQRFARPYKNT